MSWKRFMGWEPLRTSSIDEHGVTRAVTEPEWDEESRDEMLALAAWEESRCPACGGPADECQSPEAEFRFQGTPPIRCHRKDAILRYQDKAGSYERSNALLWRAEERD